jgi:hypothetical protein
MSDDPTNPPGNTPEPAADAGKAPEASRSVEDLKAKLGLKTKKVEEATAAEAARPKAPSAADFGLGLGDQRPAPAPGAPATSSAAAPAVEYGEPVQAKPMERKHLVAIAAISLLMMIIGVFFGGVLKGRALENSKTREAKHLIEYFTETPLAQTGKAATTVMNAVQAHVGEIARVVDLLGKASESKDVKVRLDAEKELTAFLKRAQDYRDLKPFFVLDQAYPGIVFNGELASQVTAYIENVKNLYSETVLLALEADTLERVGETEEKGVGANHVILIQPAEADGTRKATWIQAVDKENPRQGPGGVEYAVLPVGGEKGMVVAASSLAEIDISPIAKEKSIVYRSAIFDRVRARLGQMKLVSDQVQFDPLKEKLQKFASRGAYITLF